MSTLTIAKFTSSTRTDFIMQTRGKKSRAITMLSTFTSDCRYEFIIFKLIGNINCPNEICSGKLCVNKKTFQPLTRCDNQCPLYTSSCQVRNIPFEEQTNSFLLKCNQGFIFLKGHKNQFKMLLENSIVLEVDAHDKNVSVSSIHRYIQSILG